MSVWRHRHRITVSATDSTQHLSIRQEFGAILCKVWLLTETPTFCSTPTHSSTQSLTLFACADSANRSAGMRSSLQHPRAVLASAVCLPDLSHCAQNTARMALNWQLIVLVGTCTDCGFIQAAIGTARPAPPTVSSSQFTIWAADSFVNEVDSVDRSCVLQAFFSRTKLRKTFRLRPKEKMYTVPSFLEDMSATNIQYT
jgi:hypothetical protein